MLGLTFSRLLAIVFVTYLFFTTRSLFEVFYPKPCTDSYCITPLWNPDDKLKIELDLARHFKGISRKLIHTEIFSIDSGISIFQNCTVPVSVYQNGSIAATFRLLTENGSTIWIQNIDLVSYRERIHTALNLLSDKNDSVASAVQETTISIRSFWLSKLRVYILDTPVSFSQADLPLELVQKIRMVDRGYLPLVFVNPAFQTSLDWQEIKPLSGMLSQSEVPTLELEMIVEPLSIGRFRLRCMLELMAHQLRSYGFKSKEIDEMRGIFLDTNFYLLLTTVFVSLFHLLFDFLAFKNDISFWRNTKNTVGLSMRTVIWRLFSSLIIFLHLKEEQSSLLVIVPMGISTLIELWKLCRITKFTFTFGHGIQWGKRSKYEEETDQLDAKFMNWLILFMIPLCLAGSIYSLLYLPHRSWYSWCLQTLVNGVYAFGFLLMTPQLFLNYRLKSVAHLPWEALTYKIRLLIEGVFLMTIMSINGLILKPSVWADLYFLLYGDNQGDAFNTFIDDFFAFIIVMPTSHRIACLRDDVVFLIYLYQRWLYPVDKSRINEFGQCCDSDSNLNKNKEKIKHLITSDDKIKTS